jgi:putative hemin transport protein
MTQAHAEQDLADAWAAAKARNPAARARDIADKLGVSEGALVEARAYGGNGGVRRLAPAGESGHRLIAALAGLGPVMTLTRNEAAVHETTGPVTEVGGEGLMGQTTGPIDLRLFYRHWHAAYAVEEDTRSGWRQSLQVFDRTGTAVLKVYAVAETDGDAWSRAIDELAEPAREPVTFEAPEAPAADPADSAIDRDALRDQWQNLAHSHDFHRMLRDVGVGREQALRLAGADLAAPVEIDTVRRVLEGAASDAVPIMCFVGNRGCLQIFSGAIGHVEPVGPWLNIMDPGFNLHLHTGRVASVWRVIKPTRLRGRITSLECFDDAGTLVCQLFGERPMGEGERAAWRALVGHAVGEGESPADG